MHERRSDAFVKNGANKWMTCVWSNKCILGRGVHQLIFPLLQAQNGNSTRLHKSVRLKSTKLWSRGQLMWKKNE